MDIKAALKSLTTLPVKNAIRTHISGTAFLKASVAFAVLLCVLMLMSVFTLDKTLQNIEQDFTSEKIAIERALQTPTPQTHHTSDGAVSADGEKEGHGNTTSHTQSDKALYPAPIDGLFEKQTDGTVLPIIAPNGLSAFKAYQKPFSPSGKPLISIVVKDYGLSHTQSRALIEQLPGEVSLMLSPYSVEADEWQRLAREDGHEVWMNLPAQTENYPRIDPGARAIMSTLSLKKNQENLKWMLSRTSGYSGVAISTDVSITRNVPMVRKVVETIFNRGLAILEINPQGTQFVKTVSSDIGAPYVRNNVFLNETSLKLLEGLARSNGSIIGVVEPTPKAIEALKIWLSTLPQKGFDIAPLSAVVEKKNKHMDYQQPPPPHAPSQEKLKDSGANHGDEHH